MRYREQEFDISHVAREAKHMSHIPVLFHEVIALLAPKRGEFAIDGTLGGGGHARGILDRIMPGGSFLGVDWDKEMIARFEQTIREDDREGGKIVLVCANYAELKTVLHRKKLGRADMLLLDLGFSSAQLEGGKGLSFRADEPLDMRYGLRKGETAAEVVNTFSEEHLRALIADYGEERYAFRVAKAIVAARRRKRILRTAELRDVILTALPQGYERGRIDPATRTFQALRIFVNHELENVTEVLRDVPSLLKPGGRVAVIAFHSLEDRIVKRAMQTWKRENIATLVTRKPIVASAIEQQANPRSRSAKLRVAQMN